MSPIRPGAALVAIALIAALSGCRSTRKAPEAKTVAPAVSAAPVATPIPARPPATPSASALAVAPWASPRANTVAPTPVVSAPAQPPIDAAPATPAVPLVRESTELRPAVPAPPLPGGGPFQGSSPSASSPPVLPATAPAVAAAPLNSASTTPADSHVTVPSIVVAPSAPRVAPPPSSTPAPAADAWPTTASAFVAELRRRAASGHEPELSKVIDLLDAALAALPSATSESTTARLKEIEAAEQARVGRGQGWATLTAYVEAGADATAMRAAYLDFERVGEYTGKPGTKTLRREGDVTIGKTDAIRKVLTLSFGARWTFRAKSLDRGAARIIVTSQIEADDTSHMITTRGMMIALPARDGLLVIEANSSLVDFDVPGLVKGTADALARKELLARTNGIRAHWRDYVKK